MSVIDVQLFDEIVRKRLFVLSQDHLLHYSAFQEYMSEVRMAMASLDENVIGLAIATYIHLEKKENETQEDGGIPREVSQY